MEITQWEVYDHKEKIISPKEALENLIRWLTARDLDNLIAKTQIIIATGYQFKIVNGLITNFHQPQSTLLLLVAAFIGKNPIAIGWKEVYDYALKNNFRFLSYGDGSLLWRNP
jgi:S-adenosylmethionine:tRNA ribosyltransferase-isomerase